MNVTDLNTTHEYDYMRLANCTDNENNIVVIIQTFFLTIPCGLSFLCLMSLMVYKVINSLRKTK